MLPTDPKPIQGRIPKRPKISWNAAIKRDFPRPQVSFLVDRFSQVLTKRRSSRMLSVVSPEIVANVIRRSLQVSDFGTGPNNGRLRKAVLSAGAVHPIKGLFFRGYSEILFYDDLDDAFFEITPYNNEKWYRFVDCCAEVLPQNNGYWLLLFADSSDTKYLYEEPDSLIWRDAGAALQVLAMVSNACGLVFCPAGLLGQNGLDSLTDKKPQYIAAGVAAIGSE